MILLTMTYLQMPAPTDPQIGGFAEPPTAAAGQWLLDGRWALADPHCLFELEAHAFSH